jgi:hypothetical protein
MRPVDLLDPVQCAQTLQDTLADLDGRLNIVLGARHHIVRSTA